MSLTDSFLFMPLKTTESIGFRAFGKGFYIKCPVSMANLRIRENEAQYVLVRNRPIHSRLTFPVVVILATFQS